MAARPVLPRWLPESIWWRKLGAARMKDRPVIKFAPRKLGVEAHDQAAKPRRLDRNFSQSKDIHEDRGTVQSQMGRRKQGPRL